MKCNNDSQVFCIDDFDLKKNISAFHKLNMVGDFFFNSHFVNMEKKKVKQKIKNVFLFFFSANILNLLKLNILLSFLLTF